MTDTHRPLWGPNDVAEYLGVSRKTVYRLRADDPTFPPPITFGGRTVRWRPETVVEWTRLKEGSSPVRRRRGGRPKQTLEI